MAAMMALPPFILRRLYVRGSLVNTPSGCEITLRNHVGTGNVTQFLGLDIDGRSHAPEELAILLSDGATQSCPEVTPEAPLAVRPDVDVTIRVKGVRLEPGQHALRLRFLTRELGVLEIAFSDAVGERASGMPRSTVAAGSEAADPARVTATVDRTGPSPGPARPLRIAIIGAGSTVFARQIMADILATPGLTSGTFVLVDVDARRLELARRIGQKMAAATGRRWRVETHRDRRKALPGCHYVINTIEVAGLRNVGTDYDVPLRYGVDQCIGDTIGPGGIFKMLRTGPTWLAIVRDIERLCPDAVVFNYTNPMSALTLLALRAGELQQD